MGKQSGRGVHWVGSKRQGIAPQVQRLPLLMLLLLALAGCVVSPPHKTKSGGKEWQRKHDDSAFMLERCFYGTPEQVQQMLEELGDVAQPVKGWARMGNGAVSLRLVDQRGRALPMVECGGRLLVTGSPGQAYALMVRNETDATLEVLPMVDGLSLATGQNASLEESGRLVGPRETSRFDTQMGSGGKAEPLQFRGIEGIETLHRSSPTGTLGSIVVAVFLEQGAESFDARHPLERRRSDGPGLRQWPQRRYEPMLLPYQYR